MSARAPCLAHRSPVHLAGGQVTGGDPTLRTRTRGLTTRRSRDPPPSWNASWPCPTKKFCGATTMSSRDSRAAIATSPTPSSGTPKSSPIASTRNAISPRTRRLLIGATFTSEYAVEGAALCNPSMVDPPGPIRGQPRGSAVRDECPGHRRGPQLLHRLQDGDPSPVRVTSISIRRLTLRRKGAGTGRCAMRRYSKPSSAASWEAATMRTTYWTTSDRVSPRRTSSDARASSRTTRPPESRPRGSSASCAGSPNGATASGSRTARR